VVRPRRQPRTSLYTPSAHGHSCIPASGSSAHACDSASDLLYPTVEEGVSLTRLRLDVGSDDYYGLPDARADSPDVRDSPFLERLAGTQTWSPAAVSSLWATTTGGAVTLSWRSGGPPSALTYRIYRDARLLTETDTFLAHDSAAAGTTVTYVVRAADAAGFLGAGRTIRVLVGSGVVDARGELVADTIPPRRVTGLRVERAKPALVLRWKPVAGIADLAGYRIYRNNRAFGVLCRRPPIKIDLRLSRARWAIAAVDSSGNEGQKSSALNVR
jgi:hypothetical protein